MFDLKRTFPWWNRSYLLDYGIQLLIWAVVIFIWQVMLPTDRFQMTLPSQSADYLGSINRTHVDNEVFVFSWTCPMFIFTPPVFFAITQYWYRSSHDLHSSVLAFSSGGSMLLLSTGFFKKTFGFLRPDFLSRCKPDENMKCTAEESFYLQDGRMTFPSGHASMSWFSFGFLALYLCGKLRPFDGSRSHSAFARSVIVMFFPLFATYVCATRVADFRHFLRDVSVGSLLGIVWALISYHLFYPALWKSDSEYPFERRDSLARVHRPESHV
eukprot:TRINITY_DN13578_c0_g1_i1.p1 TRINITY_DN13578_c0_g1~~TRINITY_DN13578_c0_g1_i1.p1  ORF type:complete len:305 (-),score=70.20 TRINITY_DN13578_c0_g1_i1:38-847(-)